MIHTFKYTIIEYNWSYLTFENLQYRFSHFIFLASDWVTHWFKLFNFKTNANRLILFARYLEYNTILLLNRTPKYGIISKQLFCITLITINLFYAIIFKLITNLFLMNGWLKMHDGRYLLSYPRQTCPLLTRMLL